MVNVVNLFLPLGVSIHETNLEKKIYEVLRWFTWSPRHHILSIHLGVLNIGKIGGNQKLTHFWRFFRICSYPLAKNVISSSLKMITNLKMMKHFENSSSLRSGDTPKMAFLVILDHIWNLRVGQGHIFETKLEWRSILGHQT